MQISAWLTNSLDPIEGNHQKTDKYWKKIAALYNETAPMDRKRDAKHCKDHWGRSVRKIVQFNGCWSVLNSVYTSGRLDDQLLAEARLKYKANTGTHFILDHWWEAVRNQPKWNMTYVTKERSTEGKRTKVSASGAYISSNDTGDAPMEDFRPEGRDAAKERRNKGKTKVGEAYSSNNEARENFMRVQQDRNDTLKKSADSLLAYSRRKERSTLMKSLTKLVTTNTSGFTNEQMMDHAMALKYVKDMLKEHDQY